MKRKQVNPFVGFLFIVPLVLVWLAAWPMYVVGSSCVYHARRFHFRGRV